jgi:hypothetical protein
MAENDTNVPKPAAPSFWGIPVDEWSGADAIKALHETISQFRAESIKQTRKLIVLTRVIAALTVVMLIGLAIQIYLAIR